MIRHASFMKFCLSLAALIVLCSVGQCEAQEPPIPPSLSPRTIRGYAYASGRWQQHVCLTLTSTPTQLVVQTSPNGAPRQLGHTVRCHHGVVFVPRPGNEHIVRAPNRSSHNGK